MEKDEHFITQKNMKKIKICLAGGVDVEMKNVRNVMEKDSWKSITYKKRSICNDWAS